MHAAPPSSLPRRRWWWVGPLLAVALMVGLVEAGVAWLAREEWQRRDQRFQAQTQRIQEEVNQQVSRAGDLLRSAQALFLEGREPDQTRWDAFAREVELEAHYPAIRSLQWVPRVLRKELPAFEARLRKVHGAGFRVWSLPEGPEGTLQPADEYFPIALVYPKGLGGRGLGFDVYSRASTRDQVVDVILRQSAMRIGSRVELVEEPGTIAFGLTGPIFDRPIGPGEGFLARRGALRGLVTCMCDGRRFFGSVIANEVEPVALAAYEGPAPQASALLFSNLPAPGAASPGHERYSSLTAHGRTWTFRFQSTPAWEGLQSPGTVRLARLMGWALSLAVGALIAVLTRSREHALSLVRARTAELEARNEELRKQSLEHFASERAREDLLVVVNHGLRTPLTALRGALSVLGEDPGPPPETRRELLGQAQRNSERALVLVNDLIDLHRLEMGKLSLDRAEFNLRSALQEAAQGFESLAASQGRSLRLECPDGLHATADPKRLQQVLTNLLGNALRHGLRGSAIRIWAESISGGRVRVSVHNLGEPLSESVRVKLFGLNRTMSTTGSRLPGLGLPIAKGLVEAMGGTMGHVSVEGGNTFWFELPGRG